MLRLVLGQLRVRRIRSAALIAGVIIATVSFVLLTSTSGTTDVRVRGSVESNFRSAYDILVRPRGSFAQVERSQGLVRNNYLSGIFGGITFEQYARIKRLHGVEVAAPIANIGYVLPAHYEPVSLKKFVGTAPFQVLRVRSTWLESRGTSRYPAEVSYLYYSERSRFVPGNRSRQDAEIVAGRDVPLPGCGVGFYNSDGLPVIDGPFDSAASFSCYSPLTPDWNGSAQQLGVSGPYVTQQVGFPLLLAAIDPEQEARLLRLDRTVVAGRYLLAGELPSVRRSADEFSDNRPGLRFVPVIASTRTFVDADLELKVERLRLPAGIDLPGVLSSTGAFKTVSTLPASLVGKERITAATAYQHLLEGFQDAGRLDVCQYWLASPTRYGFGTEDQRLLPRTTTNPTSIWKSFLCQQNLSGYAPAPQSNRDLQFRRLIPREGDYNFDRQTQILNTPRLQIVGRYDPAKLPGFSPLSRVPLETYYPPALEPADEGSHLALKGKPLLPSQNIGDYIQQPPLLLTTLSSVRAFTDRRAFPSAKPRAPLSVIRVRVAGVRGPDDLSLARIRSVAGRIRDATGLDVDITAGSSPRELLVSLPAGKFGRPELQLREGWAKKGVSISFLQALDEKRLALFILVPLVCGFFLANGVFAAVAARRSEIGTLLTLGWSRVEVAGLILGELALLGLLAGAAGAAIAAGTVALLDLEVAVWRTLLVVPLALGLALAAGLLPALRASRGLPIAVLQPPVRTPATTRSVRDMSGLAMVNLLRLPARTLVAVAALAVGVAALTVLLAINRAFEGTLIGTLLGEAISFQVRGVDFLAVGLVIGLAGLSLADLLFLSLRERAGELATLRTVGWSERELRRLLSLEAIGLGLAGGVTGALGGLLAGFWLDVSLGPLALAAALAAFGGLLVALLASLLPLSQLARLTPVRALAAE